MMSVIKLFPFIVCTILCKLLFFFLHIFHDGSEQGILLVFQRNVCICELQTEDCLCSLNMCCWLFLNRSWWLPPTIHKKFWKREDQWRAAATHHSPRAWGTGSHSHWPPRTDTGSSGSAMCIGKWFLASLILIIWVYKFPNQNWNNVDCTLWLYACTDTVALHR